MEGMETRFHRRYAVFESFQVLLNQDTLLRIEEISYQVIYASLLVHSTQTVHILKRMYAQLRKERQQ